MQKFLNTRGFALFWPLLRIVLASRAGLMAGLGLLLVGLASPAKASAGYNTNSVTITVNNTTPTAYTTNKPGSTQLKGQLGNFLNRTDGSIPDKVLLTGIVNTNQGAPDEITSSTMYYRVYSQGSAPGPFQSEPLPFQSSTIGNKNIVNKVWSNTTSKPDLVALAGSIPGTYVLEMYFQSSVNTTPPTFILDAKGGANYTATFGINVGDPAATQWVSSTNTDWFNSANWDHGVPTKTTDAIIKNSSINNYPVIDNTAAGAQRIAEVHEVRMLGDGTTGGNLGGQVLLKNSTLKVYGNLQDNNRGLIQTGGTFILAGNNQYFDGESFTNIRVEGGGTKTLTAHMDVTSIPGSPVIPGTLTMVDGVLVGRNDDPSKGIDLDTNAQVVGESENSYILGVLRALTRTVTPGSTNSFGNIGIDLTANDATIASTPVPVTRLSKIYLGSNNSRSIRRSFGFGASTPSINDFSLVFHYLNVILDGVAPANLSFFRSANDPTFSGALFLPVSPAQANETLNLANKTLTHSSITGPLAASLFTLGDFTHPLPVALTSFTAAAQGPDAVLTWATAQETNNKGFEVQVSGDGAAFRTLGFVAAETPNSAAARSYRFRDTEGGKQGTRYYRLRQLDLDGGESFFGPQAVAFGARARTASALGYPNPFGAELTLALQTLAAGPAAVSLFDMTGRQVRTYQPTLAAGASSVRLDDLQSLPHGLYVVQVRYSDGQTQRLKLIKE